MQPEILRIRQLLASGTSVEQIVATVYDRVLANEGSAPVLCRTDAEILVANTLEWGELTAAAKALGAAEQTLKALETAQQAVNAALTAEFPLNNVTCLRALFEDLGGIPPAVASVIVLAGQKQEQEDVTPTSPKNTAFRTLREVFSGLPETELHLLATAVAARPVHAFITVVPREQVLAKARGLDALHAKGLPLPPLAGVTLAVKDNFALGTTTGASRILSGYTAPGYYVATAIERLTRAGAIVIGKANLDELALGSSNESTAYWPAPRNPRNTARVTGGSSGGSAAAVAAGFSAIALGSDTSGSIRLPAAYCGVVGVKPTYGLVSRYGMFALASSLDCAGPIARTVHDAAITLGYLAAPGPDGKDQTLRLPARVRTATSAEELYAGSLSDGSWKQHLHGRAVGVPVEFFLDLDPDDEPLRQSLLQGGLDFSRLSACRSEQKLTGLVAGTFMRWAEQRVAAGGLFGISEQELSRLWAFFTTTAEYATAMQGNQRDKLRGVAEYWRQFPRLISWLADTYGICFRLVSLPHTWLSIPAYMVISRQEVASNLHRYDGLKYGRQADWLEEKYDRRYQAAAVRNRMQCFGKQPKLRVMMGINVLQEKNSNLLSAARRARQLIHNDFENVFASGGVACLLSPATNSPAPLFGGFADTVTQQKLDEFTVPANLAGIPSCVIPFYPEADGMAQSVQVMAPPFMEKEMFELGRAVEEWRTENGIAL